MKTIFTNMTRREQGFLAIGWLIGGIFGVILTVLQLPNDNTIILSLQRAILYKNSIMIEQDSILAKYKKIAEDQSKLLQDQQQVLRMQDTVIGRANSK